MMKIKYILVVAVLATAILGFGGTANGQTIDIAAQIQALLEQIAQLQAQLQALQNQQNQGQSWCHTFTRNLGFAQSGSTEIGDLKTALIKSGVWPYEAVTYDYDEETASYVVKFQAKYGILQSGYVGPLTRVKLNALYGCSGAQTDKVIFPKKGDVWQVGGTYDVKWNSQALSSDKVSVALINNDNNKVCDFDSISNTGIYKFTVPVQAGFGSCDDGSNLPGNNYQIKVWLKNKTLFSETFSVVSSAQPSITLTSPNGGETWQIGKIYDITWSANKVINPVIYLNFYDGGMCLIKTIPQDQVASGKYSYLITESQYCPNLEKTLTITPGKYKIVIYGDTEDVKDSSDNYFSIVAATAQPSITLTSPSAGEEWLEGAAHNITWNYTGIDTVDIAFNTTGSGSVPTLIKSGVQASLGSYSWDIPANFLVNWYKKEYFIIVTKDFNKYLSGNYSVSDAKKITIVSPTANQHSVTVTSPNGGEKLVKGQNYNITWNSTGVSSVYINIMFYESPTDTGRGGSLIVGPVNATTGSYTWNVSESSLAGGQFIGSYFKISISAGYGISDDSDGFFTISSATNQPSVTVTSPNGGETWTQGSTHDITWTSSGINNVGIELTDENSNRICYLNNNLSIAATAGKFTFTINTCKNSSGQIINIPNGKYKVKITSYWPEGGEAGYSDSSDSYFTISAATTQRKITSISPTSGPVDGGTVFTIKGSGFKNGDIVSIGKSPTTIGTDPSATNITVSSDGTTITATTPAGTAGPANVYVGDPVITNVGSILYGGFNYVAVQQSVTVASPNGGETWKIGETHNVTWASTGLDSEQSIGIALVSNPAGPPVENQPFVTIKNSSSYAWTIPSTITPGSYKISVTSTANPVMIDDWSNYAFTIAAAANQPVANALPLKSSSAPSSAVQNSSFQIKCDFGIASLPCIAAYHGSDNCSYVKFEGTTAIFNCVAKNLGAQDNYCNIFSYSSDSRCTAQTNKIGGTNVSAPLGLDDSQNQIASISDALKKIAEQIKNFLK